MNSNNSRSAQEIKGKKLIRRLQRKKLEVLIPSVRVPCPPEITPEEIVKRRSNEDKLASRPPNNFFLYRIAFINELKKTIVNPSMIRISPLIGEAWKSERLEVKEAYKKLSEEIGNQLEIERKKILFLIPEKFPKPRPRSESEQQPSSEIVPEYSNSTVLDIQSYYPPPHLLLPYYDFGAPIQDGNIMFDDVNSNWYLTDSPQSHQFYGNTEQDQQIHYQHGQLDFNSYFNEL